MEDRMELEIGEHQDNFPPEGQAHLRKLCEHIVGLGQANAVESWRKKEERVVRLAMGWVLEDGCCRSFPGHCRLFDPEGRNRIGPRDPHPDLVLDNGWTADAKAYPGRSREIWLKPTNATLYMLFCYHMPMIWFLDANLVKRKFSMSWNEEWRKSAYHVKIADISPFVTDELRRPMRSRLLYQLGDLP